MRHRTDQATEIERARRGFVYVFLLGCLVGGIFDFIGYAPGQVSYWFDDSVPYPIEDVQKYVAKQIHTHPGDYCRVAYMRWDDYEARFGTGPTARYLPNPCRIYFRDWSYTSFGPDHHFLTLLIHELLHAWGVGHSTNPESVMFPEYDADQSLQMMDRFALWIARQRSEPATRK